MADAQSDRNVQLDLNNEVFQENWLGLEKQERNRVTDTLKKLRQRTWSQVYRDQGLKWEKVASINFRCRVRLRTDCRMVRKRTLHQL